MDSASLSFFFFFSPYSPVSQTLLSALETESIEQRCQCMLLLNAIVDSSGAIEAREEFRSELLRLGMVSIINKLREEGKASSIIRDEEHEVWQTLQDMIDEFLESMDRDWSEILTLAAK